MSEATVKRLVRDGGVVDLLVGLVMADGSGSHPYPRSQALGGHAEAARNLADALHYLGVLHGRIPGVVDHAADRNAMPAAFGWFARAVVGFRSEREHLSRLVAAAGPLPSTPGQAQTEAAVAGQRHALEMLARSERRGTALGAAAALVMDWAAIRAVLDTAAMRLDLSVPRSLLPSTEETLAAVSAVADSPAVERALSFGAQQTLLQHRGLWDLLEARQLARRDS